MPQTTQTATTSAPHAPNRRTASRDIATPWSPLHVGGVPALAGDGQLLRIAARSVAQVFHPMEEMRGEASIAIHSPHGPMTTFTVEGHGCVRVTTDTDCDFRISGSAELRAHAQVLSALVAALDAHDALDAFADEVEVLEADESSARRQPRRRVA